MRVRIDRTRMAMGAGEQVYSYRLVVPAAECPWIDPCDVITICMGAGRYYSFEDATLPPAHWQRERGWERYEARVAHEQACKPIMLALAQSKYPELRPLPAWPWMVSLPVDVSHAVKYAEVQS